MTLVLQTAFLRPRARARARAALYRCARCIPNDTRSCKKAGHRRRLHLRSRPSRVCVKRARRSYVRTSATTALQLYNPQFSATRDVFAKFLTSEPQPQRSHSSQNTARVCSFATRQICVPCASKAVLDTRKYYSAIFT